MKSHGKPRKAPHVRYVACRCPMAGSLLVSPCLDPKTAMAACFPAFNAKGEGGPTRCHGAHEISDPARFPDAADHGRGNGTVLARAFTAQAECARPAGLLHRRGPALSFRQSRLPRLDRPRPGR